MMCAICKNLLDEQCYYCETKPSSECVVVVRCYWNNHNFHKHCIDSWTAQRNVCPLDNTPWKQYEKTPTLLELCCRVVASHPRMVIELWLSNVVLREDTWKLIRDNARTPGRPWYPAEIPDKVREALMGPEQSELTKMLQTLKDTNKSTK